MNDKMPLHTTMEGEELARLKHRVFELNNLVKKSKELCSAILDGEHDFKDMEELAEDLWENLTDAEEQGIFISGEEVHSNTKHKEEIVDEMYGVDSKLIATEDLLEVTTALLEYIDAIPNDIELPAMPGIDRDWVDFVVGAFEEREPDNKNKNYKIRIMSREEILAAEKEPEYAPEEREEEIIKGKFASRYSLGEIVSLKMDKSELQSYSLIIAITFTKKDTIYSCRRTNGVIFNAEEDELCIRGLDYDDEPY